MYAAHISRMFNSTYAEIEENPGIEARVPGLSWPSVLASHTIKHALLTAGARDSKETISNGQYLV